MSGKVKKSHGYGERVDSWREYTTLEVSGGFNSAPGDSLYGRVEHKSMTLYIDEKTGLVTTDVGRFEEWIEGVENAASILGGSR